MGCALVGGEVRRCDHCQGVVRTITIAIPDGKSIGWCAAGSRTPPDDSRMLVEPYRPDSFTDEVSFE